MSGYSLVKTFTETRPFFQTGNLRRKAVGFCRTNNPISWSIKTILITKETFDCL